MTFAAPYLSLVAAAAAAMPENEFGVWGPEPVPWWEQLLFYGVLGLVPLPFALLITWVIHRAEWNIPVIFCLVLSALGALVGFIGLRSVNIMIFLQKAPAVAASEAIQRDDEFVGILATIVFVGVLGSAAFGSWLRRRRRAKMAAISSDAFE